MNWPFRGACAARLWPACRLHGQLKQSVYAACVTKTILPLARNAESTGLARLTAGFLAAFDTVLGGFSIARPDLVEKFLGLDGGPGGRALVRRTGVVWSAYALANAIAAKRGRKRDWQVLMWMRAMEVPADPLWVTHSAKPVAGRAKLMLWSTPLWNMLFTAIFYDAARKSPE